MYKLIERPIGVVLKPGKLEVESKLQKQSCFIGLSSERVINENVIGMLKRFKIISERYRNRRKRFGLRFNLIAAIYNMELA